MAYIISSGESSNGIILTNDSMTVLDGGIVTDTTVNIGGKIIVSGGGTATGIIENGGYVSVSNGANVSFLANAFTDLTVNKKTTVHSGTTANSTTIKGGGQLIVSTGGIVNSTTISGGGELIISFGGTANNTTVSSGWLKVSSGGRANNTIVSGGQIEIYNSGAANNAIINSGGSLTVKESGRANDIIVKSRGELTVSQSATANNITLSPGGKLTVWSGGMASIAFAPFGRGEISVYDAPDYSILTYLERETNVYYGNMASGTISSANTMSELAIESGFSAIVYQDGQLANVTVNSGGSLTVSKGGKLTGRMMFDTEAYIYATNTAIFDFDLTQTSADASALVNDLSIMLGSPIYTLTVDGSESSGTYRLAEGASFFDKTIIVINTSGKQIGYLLPEQKLETEFAEYALNVTDGSLTVTIISDTIPPGKPMAIADITTPTNGDVLVSAKFSEDSIIKEYSLDGENWGTYPGGVLFGSNRKVYFRGIDAAGNISEIAEYEVTNIVKNAPYIVEYSADNFEHTLRFKVSSDALDSFRLTTGTYHSRTKMEDSTEWMAAEQPIVSLISNTPQLIQSDADGNADVFFANPAGTWESGYLAQHVGSIGDWSGTNEYAAVSGKNKLADIIEGSDDANILLMSDDENGDSLFVDDIYTDLPGSIAEQQARIARIDEIRAGAGNDIVDMTSQRFEYVGDGLTIRGGAGNDTIWANKGDNWLFGDAGNDRIVGASGNDVIAGGIGNDRMHGGGGSDVFTFCENWCVDNVEQLETGSVTLWFASGSIENWDEAALTYSDGENSVKVTGIAADKITLKFGDDGSELFASLTGMGAFFDATTERIFEESGKGILASL